MSVPRKQDGWRPGTPQDLETMYHFKQRFRELKMLLELIKSGKLDMKVIRGLLPPEMDSDAVNKKYVDQKDTEVKKYVDQKDTEVKKYVDTGLAGKASSGFGYGGQSIALKNSSTITSEEELNTELAKVYDAMTPGETKMITWMQYPLTSAWRWFGILSKSSTNNGSLIAHSAYGGGSNIVKTKNSGSWLPAEWENPPMLPDTEYRTTERWQGKPVYRKIVSYVFSSGISGVQNFSVPHGIADLDAVVGILGYTANYLLPYTSAAGTLSITAYNSTNITLTNTGTSWGANRTWYFDMKYTKK